jgi:NhaA family Na+:H+ antiporter
MSKNKKLKSPRTRRLWSAVSKIQRTWLSQTLRNETVGGALLLVSALTALIIANGPLQEWFFELRNTKLGPEFLHLNLSVGTWAADALLAVFFFAAGIELKHELVHGSLKEKSQALVPIAAALGGMILPAAIFVALNLGQSSIVGWGIPMATDIAFALAILAVVGRRLPIELRAFLLTLAVVDDLGAIIVIAIFYSSKFALLPLIIAAMLLFGFGLLQRKGVKGWYIYVPLALAIWYFVHDSGVHATVAGIAMGLLMNMNKKPSETFSAGDRALHLIHPYSAAIAVPIFAFFASGVNLSDFNFQHITQSPLALGIIFGLVVGKPIGVFLGAYLAARFTRAELSKGISWWDIAAIGSLAGVGFTVSLLISELAFKHSGEQAQLGVLSVLIASLISGVIASILLTLRGRSYVGKIID